MLIKLAIKAESKAEQNNIMKRKAFNSNYFCSKSHFEDDGTCFSQFLDIPK